MQVDEQTNNKRYLVYKDNREIETYNLKVRETFKIN